MSSDKQVYIDINLLSPNPLQPRGQILLETINELIESVKSHGVLEPLVVAETPAGMQIIAGERRWRAAKVAGLKTVPVIIKKTNPRGMLEMAIVENVQRTNLNPIERAHAYRRMVDEFGMMGKQVAERIGKSVAFVSNTLHLLDLPDAVKDGLVSGVISEGHAKAMIGIEDHALVNEIYKEILKKSLSVRQTEELARRVRMGKEKLIEKNVKMTNKFVLGEEIEEIRRKIESHIQGVHAKVKITRSKRNTRLIITLPGTLEKTEEPLKVISELFGK